MNYKSPKRQEPPRRLVIISSVDTTSLAATATDVTDKGIIQIDLTVFTPPILTYPRVGEQWYVALYKTKWVLDKKCQLGSEAYLVNNPSQGDQIWIAGGVISVEDANGSVALPELWQWTHFTLLNGWVASTTYEVPSYRTMIPGVAVQLKGKATGGSINQPLATLPSGSFPVGQGTMEFKVVASAVASSVGAKISLNNTTGTLTLVGQAATSDVGLDGIVIPLI